MSWSHDQVLRLIELYKERPCLYIVKSSQYKNKHMRASAYGSIATELKTIRPGTNINEIKSKINGLRTNFLTEHRKHVKSKRSGSGVDSVYTPSLWYYDDLLFILEHVTARKSIDSIEELSQDTLEMDRLTHHSNSLIASDEDDLVEEQTQVSQYFIDEDSSQLHLEDDAENIEENITIRFENHESDIICETPKNIQVPPRLPLSSKKRKRNEDDSLLMAAGNAINNIASVLEKNNGKLQQKQPEDVQIFGDFVVSRLRMIKNEKLRNEAEENITHILFDTYRKYQNTIIN